MQGRIREQSVSATIRSQCAHCAEPISLMVDEQLRCKVLSPGAAPLISAPLVDLRRLRAPNIIDAF